MESFHHHQALPPPFPPAYFSPGLNHPPPFMDGQQSALHGTPPISGVMPLPPWMETPPMMPMGGHGTSGDPFKPYTPMDSRAGPPPSALGFVSGPLAPQLQHPLPSPTTLSSMDPFPYPLHHLPPPPPSNTFNSAPQSTFPRPHPYIVSLRSGRADASDPHDAVHQLGGARGDGTRHSRHPSPSGHPCDRYLRDVRRPCQQ